MLCRGRWDRLDDALWLLALPRWEPAGDRGEGTTPRLLPSLCRTEAAAAVVAAAAALAEARADGKEAEGGARGGMPGKGEDEAEAMLLLFEALETLRGADGLALAAAVAVSGGKRWGRGLESEYLATSSSSEAEGM